jgi:hypothetical protein
MTDLFEGENLASAKKNKLAKISVESEEEKNVSLSAPIQSESGVLLKLAIQNNLDIEKIRALMDLRDRDEKHQAEKLFEMHFSEMQRDYVPAFKTKYGAEKAYKYCPLPQILAVYAPILSKHGFTYRWEETENPEKKEKTTTCFLSGHGFTRAASITLPYADTNKMISLIQARGITSEYGRRYSFMNITGCLVADENSDGEIPEANTAKLKQVIAVKIQLVPIGLQKKFIAELAAVKDEKVSLLYDLVNDVRARVQSKLKAVTADKKQRALETANKINTLDELVLWEESVENL